MRTRLLCALLLALGSSLAGAAESSIFDKVARQKTAASGNAKSAPSSVRAAATAKTSRPSEQDDSDLESKNDASQATKAAKPKRAAPIKTDDADDDHAGTEDDADVKLVDHRVALRQSPYLNGMPDPETEVIEPPFQIADGEERGNVMPGDESCGEEQRPLSKKLKSLRSYLRRPMQGQSWLSRPMSIGVQFGGIWGGEIIRHEVKQSSGPLFLVNIGWDHTNYDGYEVRIGGSDIHTFNELPPLNARDTRLSIFDFSALLYPWGDARLRPYGRLGLGLHEYQLVDHRGVKLDNIVPTFMVGFGVKYLFQRHIALRMEFLDNIGFADGVGLDSLNNPQLVFGMEYRFGGMHKNYWPWSSGRLIW